VDIQRTPGLGSSTKTKIPLTLAIVPALVLVCAGERIANPQVSLSEAVLAEKRSAAASVLRGDCSAGDGAADAAAGALSFRLEIYVDYGGGRGSRKK
jgi:two-component system chemotaxis sensor kinase CheA